MYNRLSLHVPQADELLHNWLDENEIYDDTFSEWEVEGDIVRYFFDNGQAVEANVKTKTVGINHDREWMGAYNRV